MTRRPSASLLRAQVCPRRQRSTSGRPGSLTFCAVERRLSPEDVPTSLWLMGAAVVDGEPIGLAFELALLNGARMVHPIQFSSIGAPTEAVIAECLLTIRRR